MAKDDASERIESIRKNARHPSEQGVAYDPTRIYRDPREYGAALELESGAPSALELERMVRLDSQARQLFSAVTLPVRGAKMDIIPREGDSGEAAFITNALFAPASRGGMTTPFRTVLSQMATAILTRAAFFEKVFKVAEDGPYAGKVVVHKLAFRPASTCTLLLDEHGSFNGFRQQYSDPEHGYKDIIIPPERALVYIHGQHENPLGVTPFENVYRNFVNKVKVTFFYFAFLENVAFPRTLVRVMNNDEDELMVLLDKVKRFAGRGILGLLADEQVEPYESRRSTSDYQAALEYLDWQMAKALMAQFLDLGTSGERGSYALSKDKSSFFLNALEAVLADIGASVENHLIAPLVRVNYGKDAVVPHLRFRPLSDEVGEAALNIFRDVIMANTPNVTPPFMLKLMKRVSEVLELEMDPLQDFDEKALREVEKTIPTPREEMKSREARAGAGQNPVTGLDKNRNNTLPSWLDRQKSTINERDIKIGGVGADRPDNVDIVPGEPPAPPQIPTRRKSRRDGGN